MIRRAIGFFYLIMCLEKVKRSMLNCILVSIGMGLVVLSSREDDQKGQLRLV